MTPQLVMQAHTLSTSWQPTAWQRKRLAEPQQLFRCGSRCGSQTRSTNSSRVPSCADSQPGVADRLDAVRILPVQSFSRRALGVFGAVFVPVKAANAIGFTKQLKKADISEADYALSEPFLFRAESHVGVKYFDTQLGGGERLEMGKVAVVHFTCRYRGLTALSTREARTLGGNRTIAEPMEFTYGVIPSEFNKPIVRKTVVGIGAEVRLDPALQELYIVSTVFNGPAEKAGLQVNDVIISIDGFQDLADLPISRIGTLLTGNMGSTVDIEVRKSSGPTRGATERFTLTREATAITAKKRTTSVETGGGLFAGTSGPKPPPVIYIPEALAGMRVGGRRVIIVPSDVGYEDMGEGEIPPGADFKLEVELLESRNAA